jgi:hypothetical protein
MPRKKKEPAPTEPVPEPKKKWFDRQTGRIQRLTVWCAFIIALSGLWGVLKIAGVDLIDVTIGCSSLSTQTERNVKKIDTLFIYDDDYDKWWRHQDSLNKYQDGLNDNFEKRILILERQ